jgi:hypothetical protein
MMPGIARSPSSWHSGKAFPDAAREVVGTVGCAGFVAQLDMVA